MNTGKAVEDVSSKGNHYVYHKRWGRVKKIILKGDEEYLREPSSASFKLQERLIHEENKKVKHSTHRHPLLSYDILEEDKVLCTICEIDITGLAYGCDEDCEFITHNSCLYTPAKIKHMSHPDHPLNLLFSPKHYGKDLFLCDACQDNGEGYHYHCSTCMFDLHVACAGLPERVHCNWHRYPLAIAYNQPLEKNKTINCNICQEVIILKGWIYRNSDSEFVTHLGCGFSEHPEESIYAIAEHLMSLKVAT